MTDTIPSLVVITEHDPDGYYQVESGQMHSIRFQVPVGGSIAVQLEHTDKFAQDFSMRCWFSNVPNGQALFPGPDHTDLWSLTRLARTFEVFDSSLAERDDPRLLAPAGTALYLNFQNLQNAPNVYRAQFGFQA